MARSGKKKPDPQEVRAKMEKVWSKALVALERGREELTKISKVGKLKFDLTRFQRDRLGLYRQLGEETYKLLKEGRFDVAEVERIIVRIDRISEQIESQQSNIKTTAK